MAGLCWMAMTLAFFLSAENTLAAVDQNRLATFVNGILGKYGPEGMFSLAASIPEDQNQRESTADILNKVYESDPSDEVVSTMNNDQVYNRNRVVAAKVLKQARGAVQAESRVVDHLNDLFSRNNRNDLLLFYVYASPCVDKCTNQGNTESILEKITASNNWNSHAFVFSKIFKPSSGSSNTEEELRGALTRLGSVIGLGNIFRCDRGAGGMQCISCSSNGQVTRACVSDDDSQPGPGSSGTVQGVQSPSGRYRRGIRFKTKGHFIRHPGGGHTAGISIKGDWSTRKFGGLKGGVNFNAGWTRKKGGGSHGRVKIGAKFKHKGGHGGHLNVKAGWNHKKGGGHSVGWGASGSWGRKKGGRRGIIIRAE